MNRKKNKKLLFKYFYFLFTLRKISNTKNEKKSRQDIQSDYV